MRVKYQAACECEPQSVRPELVDHTLDPKATEWDVELVVRCAHCGARYNENVQHERAGRQAQDLRRLSEMIRGVKDEGDDTRPQI